MDTFERVVHLTNKQVSMVQVAKALAPLLREKFPSLSPRLLDAQVRAMVRSIERPTGGGWDVGVMLTSDAHMQQLNRKFRQKDKPTDILSFPFHKVCVCCVVCS